MTMVIENQNRQYGGMGFDSVYQQNMPHHNPPQFTDPWAGAHTTSHSNPPMYATSVPNGVPVNVKQEEVNRQAPMSVSYSNIPVSAPSMVPASNYPGPEVMAMQQEIPRSNYDQAPTYTTASSIPNFAPANYSMGYAPSIQQQDGRRISHA